MTAAEPAQTILAAKGWVNTKIVNGLRDAMSEECEAAGTADECEALGSGLPAAAKPCQWEEPSTCRLNDRWGEDGSSQDWLQFTMYALFGLAIGQLIRLASSHIFRKATRDQVTQISH